jgi:hypothetical protein
MCSSNKVILAEGENRTISQKYQSTGDKYYQYCEPWLDVETTTRVEEILEGNFVCANRTRVLIN